MGYKLYSNIICPNPTESAMENIGEGIFKIVLKI